MTKLDWEINIKDLATRVAETYGPDVAASVFARYGAASFEDLSPCYYSEVFGELMQMDSDP